MRERDERAEGEKALTRPSEALTITTRRCRRCGRPIPPGKRADTKYWPPSCRVMACRERARLAREMTSVPDASSVAGSPEPPVMRPTTRAAMVAAAPTRVWTPEPMQADGPLARWEPPRGEPEPADARVFTFRQPWEPEEWDRPGFAIVAEGGEVLGYRPPMETDLG